MQQPLDRAKTAAAVHEATEKGNVHNSSGHHAAADVHHSSGHHATVAAQPAQGEESRYCSQQTQHMASSRTKHGGLISTNARATQSSWIQPKPKPRRKGRWIGVEPAAESIVHSAINSPSPTRSTVVIQRITQKEAWNNRQLVACGILIATLVLAVLGGLVWLVRAELEKKQNSHFASGTTTASSPAAALRRMNNASDVILFACEQRAVI
ncbi:hypothetical protein MRX96_034077 [Rhipicephalus microplus]